MGGHSLRHVCALTGILALGATLSACRPRLDSRVAGIATDLGDGTPRIYYVENGALIERTCVDASGNEIVPHLPQFCVSPRSTNFPGFDKYVQARAKATLDRATAMRADAAKRRSDANDVLAKTRQSFAATTTLLNGHLAAQTTAQATLDRQLSVLSDAMSALAGWDQKARAAPQDAGAQAELAKWQAQTLDAQKLAAGAKQAVLAANALVAADREALAKIGSVADRETAAQVAAADDQKAAEALATAQANDKLFADALAKLRAQLVYEINGKSGDFAASKPFVRSLVAAFNDVVLSERLVAFRAAPAPAAAAAQNAAPPPTAPTFELQWAIAATASKSYQDPNKVAWGTDQIVGAPNVTEYGDKPQAWGHPALSAPELVTVNVKFAKPVHAEGVVVVESFNPGFVQQVQLLDINGQPVIAWNGEDAASGNAIAWQACGFAATKALVSQAVVTVNGLVGSYAEIDAVGLVGSP